MGSDLVSQVVWSYEEGGQTLSITKGTIGNLWGREALQGK